MIHLMFTSFIINKSLVSILFDRPSHNQNSIVAVLTFVRVIIQHFFIHDEVEFLMIYRKSQRTNGK